jgi:hypothetical protein
LDLLHRELHWLLSQRKFPKGVRELREAVEWSLLTGEPSLLEVLRPQPVKGSGEEASGATTEAKRIRSASARCQVSLVAFLLGADLAALSVL